MFDVFLVGAIVDALVEVQPPVALESCPLSCDFEQMPGGEALDSFVKARRMVGVVEDEEFGQFPLV